MTQEELEAKRRAELMAKRRAAKIKAKKLKERRKKMVFTGVIAVLFLIFLILLISIMKDNSGTGTSKTSEKVTATGTATPVPTDTPTPTPTCTPTPTPTPDTVSMIAVGDNLYDWYLLEDGWDGNGNFDFNDNYDNIRKYVQMADFAVVNQESPLGGDEGYQGSGTEWDYIGEQNRWGSYHGYSRFNSPDACGDALVNAGFNIVTMATNHVSDFGIKALNNSIKYWETQPSVTLLGIHDSQESQDTITILEKYGIKIACLNYTYDSNNDDAINAASYSIDMLSKSRVNSDVKKAREQGADFVVVFVHWGTEYHMEVNSYQEDYTEVFLDAGVDAVVGAHPHIVEPMEWITRDDGTKMVVYYSLGNFISMFKDKRCELEGMAYLEFHKGDDGTYIKEGSIIPLVNHWEYDENVLGYRKNFTVYALQDYSDALGSEHGCVHYDEGVGFSYTYMKELAEKMWGDNIKTVDWSTVTNADRSTGTNAVTEEK